MHRKSPNSLSHEVGRREGLKGKANQRDDGRTIERLHVRWRRYTAILEPSGAASREPLADEAGASSTRLVKRTFPLNLLDREGWRILVETSPT